MGVANNCRFKKFKYLICKYFLSSCYKMLIQLLFQKFKILQNIFFNNIIKQSLYNSQLGILLLVLGMEQGYNPCSMVLGQPFTAIQASEPVHKNSFGPPLLYPPQNQYIKMSFGPPLLYPPWNQYIKMSFGPPLLYPP